MLDARNFGDNLCRLRKEKNLKQSDIADTLYVTPQTISKWERGQSYPELENMIMIASILNVPLEDLFRDSEEDAARKVYIGIDGGGTKTEFVATREDGKILQRVVLGPSNPNFVGPETTISILDRGLQEMRGIGQVSGLFAGISGGITSLHRGSIENFLRKKYPNAVTILDSDIGCVFGCAPDAEKCIAVITGTGSVVFGFDGKERHQVGGYGYLFDQGGSGFSIGRKAILYALRKSNGINPPSVLTELLESKAGGDLMNKIGDFYERGSDYIASYAPLVFQAADMGDEVAEDIIMSSFNVFAEEIKVIQDTMDVGNKVIFAGGLGHQPKRLKQALMSKVRPDTEFIFPTLPPVYGACIQAIRAVGEPVDIKAFSEGFKKSYEVYQE